MIPILEKLFCSGLCPAHVVQSLLSAGGAEDLLVPGIAGGAGVQMGPVQGLRTCNLRRLIKLWKKAFPDILPTF